jgi:hypothetical protein
MVRNRILGKQIVFVDEALFTCKTVSSTAFSAERDHIYLKAAKTWAPRIYLAAVVSHENGLEASVITDDYVNSTSFCSILR